MSSCFVKVNLKQGQKPLLSRLRPALSEALHLFNKGLATADPPGLASSKES